VNEAADVLISGAGPAGLLLACELRLAEIATIVIERAWAPSGWVSLVMWLSAT
jgi:2-polyprenyl-6-methoxyphenol hydroxylase-like FAD-dependent oxidoreductase